MIDIAERSGSDALFERPMIGTQTTAPKMKSPKEALELLLEHFEIIGVNRGKDSRVYDQAKAAIPVAELHEKAVVLLQRIELDVYLSEGNYRDIQELLEQLEALK